MNDLLTKVQALQSSRGWTFDKAFSTIVAQEQSGTFGRPKSSGDAVLVAEATDQPKKSGQNWQVRDELAKHKSLRESRERVDVTDHVDRLKRIRSLMTTNPQMEWDQAFTQICREESTGAATASQVQMVMAEWGISRAGAETWVRHHQDEE